MKDPTHAERVFAKLKAAVAAEVAKGERHNAEKYGVLLKEFRDCFDLSPAEYAEIVGCSIPTVYRREKGTSRITTAEVEEFGRKLLEMGPKQRAAFFPGVWHLAEILKREERAVEIWLIKNESEYFSGRSPHTLNAMAEVAASRPGEVRFYFLFGQGSKASRSFEDLRKELRYFRKPGIEGSFRGFVVNDEACWRNTSFDKKVGEVTQTLGLTEMDASWVLLVYEIEMEDFDLFLESPVTPYADSQLSNALPDEDKKIWVEFPRESAKKYYRRWKPVLEVLRNRNDFLH